MSVACSVGLPTPGNYDLVRHYGEPPVNLTTMKYELCKELKKAGFPQTGLKYTWYYSTSPLGLFNSGEEYLDVANHPERIVCPLLNELIEDGWFELRQEPKGIWETRLNHGITREPEIEQGKTPEEAVARLWLVFHSK